MAPWLCSLTIILMNDQVKSMLAMMGHDGGICQECKVAWDPGPRAG